MGEKAQQVFSSGGKWNVRRYGAARASATFETQAEAVARAKDLARSEGTELYIFGEDGRIRERRSYRGDRLPAKG